MLAAFGPQARRARRIARIQALRAHGTRRSEQSRLLARGAIGQFFLVLIAINFVNALNQTFISHLPGVLRVLASVLVLVMGVQLADALRPWFDRAVSTAKLVGGLVLAAGIVIGLLYALYDPNMTAARRLHADINANLQRSAASRVTGAVAGENWRLLADADHYRSATLAAARADCAALGRAWRLPRPGEWETLRPRVNLARPIEVWDDSGAPFRIGNDTLPTPARTATSAAPALHFVLCLHASPNAPP